MTPDELLQIGHHLLRRVFSYVPGGGVDVFGGGMRQSRHSFTTPKTRGAIMHGRRRIPQHTSRGTAMLINGVGGSLGDRLHPILRPGREIDEGGLGCSCNV